MQTSGYNLINKYLYGRIFSLCFVTNVAIIKGELTNQRAEAMRKCLAWGQKEKKVLKASHSNRSNTVDTVHPSPCMFASLYLYLSIYLSIYLCPYVYV